MNNGTHPIKEIITQSLDDLGYDIEITESGYISASAKDLGNYAGRLRRISGKANGWSGKGIRNILNGHIEPGKELKTAILKLAGVIDGVSPAIVGKEKLEVYADPALVKSNSLILEASKKCKLPGCPVEFVGRPEYCCPGHKIEMKNIIRRNKREEERRLKDAK